jgi:hypothetical protein
MAALWSSTDACLRWDRYSITAAVVASGGAPGVAVGMLAKEEPAVEKIWKKPAIFLPQCLYYQCPRARGAPAGVSRRERKNVADESRPLTFDEMAMISKLLESDGALDDVYSHRLLDDCHRYRQWCERLVELVNRIVIDKTLVVGLAQEIRTAMNR